MSYRVVTAVVEDEPTLEGMERALELARTSGSAPVHWFFTERGLRVSADDTIGTLFKRMQARMREGGRGGRYISPAQFGLAGRIAESL